MEVQTCDVVKCLNEPLQVYGAALCPADHELKSEVSCVQWQSVDSSHVKHGEIQRQEIGDKEVDGLTQTVVATLRVRRACSSRT